MGEPVKIVDLARHDDPAVGQRARRDIAIEFIGAGPGEKLYEELWSESENATPSAHEVILLLTRPPIDQRWLEDELDDLSRLVDGGETLELIGRLTRSSQRRVAWRPGAGRHGRIRGDARVRNRLTPDRSNAPRLTPDGILRRLGE